MLCNRDCGACWVVAEADVRRTGEVGSGIEGWENCIVERPRPA
jgi:hypothetical protein